MLGPRNFPNNLLQDALSAGTWILSHPFQVGLFAGVVFLIGGILARLSPSSKMRNGLLGLTYLALLVLSYPLMIISAGGNTRLQPMVIPALVGIFLALLLQLRRPLSLQSSETRQILFPAGSVLIFLLVIPLANGLSSLVNMALIVALIFTLTWRSLAWHGIWRMAAILALSFLFLASASQVLLPNPVLYDLPRGLSSPLFAMATFYWPVAAVALAARMIQLGLRGFSGSWLRDWRALVPRLPRLLFAALLMCYLAYQLTIAVIWDRATDGLGAVFLGEVLFFTCLVAVMVLAESKTAQERYTKSAVLFSTLLVVFILGACIIGGSNSPPEITAARAARIDRAIQRYYQRHERYPADLYELVPGYLVYLPQPVIFRDQTWCYQGGEDFYRLGYVYQPGFGAPKNQIAIRLSASSGQPPLPYWPCEDELKKKQADAPSL
jgi:hypothetical protein